MADYAISNVPRRVVYAASGTGPYAFTFEILGATDISVYKASTLLTLTTDYTVTINANGTGSVTLVTSAGTSNITIVGAKNIQRTSDFTTGGDLFANTLNDELDNQTIFVQQVAETAERGLKAPVTDPTDIAMTLPAKDGRKGKVLAFDSTTGNPVAGPALDAVTTVIAQSANINTVATNIASVNTVAGISGNVTTVAGASSNVTTVATNIANVNAVGADLLEGVSEINTVATDIANVNTVGTNISNVNAVGGISANVTTVAGISANVTTVAGVSADVTTVATNIAAVNTNAANIVAIQNASTNATNAAASASAASSSATSAGNAQVAAEAARDATLSAYDNFDDRYLGSKTTDPTLDNDGNALVAGSLYFNSVDGAIKVYTGSAWVAAYVSGSGFLSSANNLSDLSSTSSARTNLGLVIGTDVLAPSGSGASLTSLNANNISSGTLGVARGGTGSATLTANNVLLGNGTSALQAVAPGTSGNVLTSNGTTWTSAATTVKNTGYRKYIYDASTTWTKPTNLAYVQVTVVGAGGGGGGAVSTSGDNGQAGNSGAIGYKKILAASLGATETVTIGAGGAGGAAGANDGSDGGASSFGSHVTANGGSGGYYNTSGSRTTVKAAATSSGGDINYESAYLGNISVAQDTNSTNSSSSSAIWATTLPIVQFSSATSTPIAANGLPSYAYGIGGSGGDGDGISNFSGGAGYKGVVIVEEFYNLT